MLSLYFLEKGRDELMVPRINPRRQREMRGGDQAGSDGGSSPPPNKAKRGDQMMLNHLQRLPLTQIQASTFGRFQGAHLTNIEVYGSCAAQSLSEPFAFYSIYLTS